MMRAYERFLKYAAVHTASQDEAGRTPSTDRQFDLARLLVEEMKALGIEDARVDDKCYVYGTLPATEGYERAACLGFLAHLDTAPDFCGEGVKPQLHENYDGADVCLGGSGRVLKVSQFPHLKELAGRTLITTDGTTLLGADDKAGAAEILTAAQRLIEDRIPHGRISIAFTPDEEIGNGAEDLDLTAFGAAFAYTVDGGAENEIEYETFNAAAASFEVTGFNIHPGSAKGKMVNAALLAVRIVECLPRLETPRETEGYEGFFHLTDIRGNAEKAKVSLLVRDHSASGFSERLKTLKLIEKIMQERWGEETVRLCIREQYRNMREKIEPCMHLVENAKEAMKAVGLEPDIKPVRGGTDGSRLSFRGLPCPNLGTGGYAFHGPYEHITAEGMDAVVDVIVEIIRREQSLRTSGSAAFRMPSV